MTSKLQQRIINCLSVKPHTLSQLAHKLHKSKKSISSRISELRKQGNNIIVVKGTFPKYTLILNTPQRRVETWLNDNHMFGKKVNIINVANSTKLTLSETKEALSKLFSFYHILQINQNEIIIKKM